MLTLSNETFTVPMKARESKDIKSEFKRFFSYLKETDTIFYIFISRISLLCLFEFTSEFNNDTTITDMSDFMEMYGIPHSSLEITINEIKPPITNDVK